MGNMEIKIVLLDVDNTLLSFDDYVRQSMIEGFEHFHLKPYREEMFDVFTRINNEFWEALERKEITREQLQAKRWQAILDALDMDFDGPSFEIYFREKLFSSAIPVDGAPELLSYLSDRYVLGIASNGPYEQQVNRLKLGGMLDYFRYLFISERLGAVKPNREFFDECMKYLNGIEPEEIMMIGDSLTSDIAGGMAYGLRTCWYNPARRTAAVRPDYEVQTLKQIQDIL